MPKLYLIEELANEKEAFFKDYDIQNVVITNLDRRQTLKKPKLRTCRFCNKSYPDVEFTSKAHLIPRSLGNINLISDFECDNCNNKFSLWETDLNSFLGIYRTLNPENIKTPKFKSNEFEAKRIKLNSGKLITCLVNKKFDKKFDLDIEKGSAEIKYYKYSYSPISIYKIFLKIALSCLNDVDIKLYPYLLTLLQQNDNTTLKSFSKGIAHYELSTKITSPYTIVLRRKNPNAKNLMHHVQIYFHDRVYMFPLPLNILDINSVWYLQKRAEIYHCPPMLTENPRTKIYYNRNFIDLSNSSKIKEIEKFNLNTNPKALKSVASWDNDSGVNNNYDIEQADIQGMVMFQKGLNLTKEDLAEIQMIFKETKGMI